MIRRQPEFEEQQALITWARYSIQKYPDLKWLSCSLNGVKLSKAQAGKAKAAGMLRGEHDLRLPVNSGEYVGLSIEMKAGKNKPTPEQIDYGLMLEKNGWKVAFFWSWTDARDEIIKYLEQK
ncbi:MAG: hypothetical protein ABI216_22015 [Devosia sp.]